MIEKITRAYEALKLRKQIEPKALLGLSGGKDSLICLDMALEVYGKENLTCFHLDFLPGMQIAEVMLEYPRRRFGIEDVKHYTGEVALKALSFGEYGWETAEKDKIKVITRSDIFRSIARELGVQTVILGVKKLDSRTLAAQVMKGNYYSGAVMPLWDWTVVDVLAYMKVHRIDVPEAFQEGFRGVDMGEESLMYVMKKCPGDLDILESYFPFIRALPFRAQRFGANWKKRKRV